MGSVYSVYKDDVGSREKSMDDCIKVLAIVGSYRKGGIIDTAIDEILASAKEEGAEVGNIYLIDKQKQKHAVVVTSSAAPSLMARLSSQLVKLLKDASGLLGTRTIGVLFIGLADRKKQQDIGERARKKARYLGKKLASNNRIQAMSHSRRA